MKTKFTCFLLGVLMAFSTVLTGCAKKESSTEDIAGASARDTKTLVVYLMAEKEVPTATEIAIEEAINKLTKSKYKTQLDLRYYTAEEYYTKLEATIKAKKKELKEIEKKKNQQKKYQKWLKESCRVAGISYIPETTKAPNTEATPEPTVVNQEYGIIEYWYPEARENQVDIFYLGGYDKYNEYLDNEWLAYLKEEVNTSSKKLTEHIGAIYMDNVQADGMYCIPNNALVGEYTWMLLDKTLMEKYFFSESSISESLANENLYNFLYDVYKFERDDSGNLTTLPIKGSLEPTNVYYWTLDEETLSLTNKRSVLGNVYGRNAKKGDPITALNIFAVSGYTSQVRMIKRFEMDGFFGTSADQDKPFAMTVVKGGYDVYTANKDKYYVKMLACPRADYDDLYKHMLCVNDLENNVARSMEIITYLNTDATVRNLLQYGIEGENYYVDDSGVLHRYNDTYMMDVNKTGNVFMAHPEEGKPSNYWKAGVQQNEDARVLPVVGFKLEADAAVDTKHLKAAQNLADAYFARMDACKTLEELDEFFAAAKSELAANPDVKFSINTSDSGENEQSVSKFYWDWLVANGYVKLT